MRRSLSAMNHAARRNYSVVPLRGNRCWLHDPGVFSPEVFPVIRSARVQRVHARKYRAEIQPVAPAADQLGTLGVAQDIVGDFREGVVGAFGFAQDVVVPLALEFVVRGDQRIPLPPEPRGGEALVGGVVETDPQEVSGITLEKWTWCAAG